MRRKGGAGAGDVMRPGRGCAQLGAPSLAAGTKGAIDGASTCSSNVQLLTWVPTNRILVGLSILCSTSQGSSLHRSSANSSAIWKRVVSRVPCFLRTQHRGGKGGRQGRECVGMAAVRPVLVRSTHKRCEAAR
jgi:hypothetical protein